MGFFKRNKLDIFCIVCGAEFEERTIPAGMWHCPHCSTVISPAYKKYDGYIRINWRELSMMARHIDMIKIANPDSILKDGHKALDNILAKLKTFKPQGAPDLIQENGPRMHITLNTHDIPSTNDQSIPSPYYKKHKPKP